VTRVYTVMPDQTIQAKVARLRFNLLRLIDQSIRAPAAGLGTTVSHSRARMVFSLRTDRVDILLARGYWHHT